MNNKRERFVRLAENRVNSAIKNIQLIGNLSNCSAYQYSQDDISKIFSTLRKEIRVAESKFNKKGRNNSFKL